jgi:hypothetical protein
MKELSDQWSIEDDGDESARFEMNVPKGNAIPANANNLSINWGLLRNSNSFDYYYASIDVDKNDWWRIKKIKDLRVQERTRFQKGPVAYFHFVSERWKEGTDLLCWNLLTANRVFEENEFAWGKDDWDKDVVSLYPQVDLCDEHSRSEAFSHRGNRILTISVPSWELVTFNNDACPSVKGGIPSNWIKDVRSVV